MSLCIYRQKRRVLKVTLQVATPGAESAVYDCLVSTWDYAYLHARVACTEQQHRQFHSCLVIAHCQRQTRDCATTPTGHLCHASTFTTAYSDTPPVAVIVGYCTDYKMTYKHAVLETSPFFVPSSKRLLLGVTQAIAIVSLAFVLLT